MTKKTDSKARRTEKRAQARKAQTAPAPARSPNGRTGAVAKPTAKSGLSATRDAFGRRLSGAAHFIGVVLYDAKAPLTSGAVLHAVNTMAAKNGIALRSGVSNQLNAMALESLAELTAGGWQLTDYGRKLWKSGVGVTRTELRSGKTLAETRQSFHKTGKTAKPVKPVGKAPATTGAAAQ